MSFTALGEYGKYLHKLTLEEMPSHHHYISGYSDGFGGSYYYTLIAGANSYGSKNTNENGGDKPHNNLQPSIGVYFWHRIS